MKNFLRNLIQVFLLILFIFLLVLFGIFWFDYLGLIRSGNTLRKIAGKAGITLSEKAPKDREIPLEEDRIKNQKKSLELQVEALKKQKRELGELEQNIKKKQDAVKIKNEELEEKETSLNQILKQYDNKKNNLRKSVANLNGMPPEKAVAILSKMNEADAVDILRTADKVAAEKEESSLVPYWISLMDAEKGASIQQLLIMSPAEDGADEKN